MLMQAYVAKFLFYNYLNYFSMYHVLHIINFNKLIYFSELVFLHPHI